MSDSPALTLALYYASRGWFVFPVHALDAGRCTCGKHDCQNAGKHPIPKHGLNEASTDPERIRAWWKQHSYANIGIRCGMVSGLVVIDIDPRHGGDETWLELITTHGQEPLTIEALTGGGGRHIYFAHPGVKVKTAKNVLGPGVDVRADGGYVVAAPSIHASGRRYEWEPSCLPRQTPLAELPAWLLEVVKDDQPTEQRKAADPVGDFIPAGERNQTLTSLAGTMRRRGMSRDAIYAALMEENRARCNPQLTPDEVMMIARSVGRYQPTAAPAPQGKDPILPREPMDAYGAAMAFLDLLDHLEGRSVPTYIPKLDDALGGIERQTLTVLAARPSMGKSTLAWQIARNVATAGLKAYFFSLEMSAPSLWAKAACGMTGVRWKDVRSQNVTDEQLEMVINASNDLMNRYADNLLLDDGTNTSETIWAQVERHRPDLVVIDHLRLIADPGENETKRLGVVSQRLKDMSKSFNTAVLCLAQLNRGVEAQTDKRPTLADLRDSGQIEENADVVLMLYRDDYYTTENAGNRYSMTEVLVRKFRDDIKNQRVKLAFDTRTQWFETPDGKIVDLNTEREDWTR